MQGISTFETRCPGTSQALVLMRQAFSIFIFLMLSPVYSVFAQNGDSLRAIYRSAPNDTSRARLLIEFSEIYYNSRQDTVIPLCEEALRIIDKALPGARPAEKHALLYAKSSAFNNIGFIYSNRGDVNKALDYLNRSLEISKQIHDKQGIAYTLNNLGLIYRNQGNLPKAINCWHETLKIAEEIGDKDGIATALNNLGLIFRNQSDPDKALEYYLKSLAIYREIKDREGEAYAYNNIALIYRNKGNTSKALEFWFKGLRIQEETHDHQAMANSYNNIGYIYMNQGDLLKAKDYFNRSLELQEKLQDKDGMVGSLVNLATAMEKAGHYNEALQYGERSLQLARELGYPENLESVSAVMGRLYAQKGDFKKAFDMQRLNKQMSDSINKESNRRSLIQKNFQYEYEKKVAADSLKSLESRRLFDVQMAHVKGQRSALFVLILLSAVFAAFMYNRFRLTRKQKEIIEAQKTEVEQQRVLADSRRVLAEEQKQIIEEKQKEILDSIHYASRIQKAMLTSEAYIRQHFRAEYFIYYKPKDIVSGDFYWAVAQHKKFYMITADCTGHGVPGAFMSLLNISYLSENILERGFTEPGQILNRQREQIIRALNPGGHENSKDGMDCVLCVYDLENMRLEIAAANNPLWLLRDEKMIEYKPDKMPVGKQEEGAPPFRTQSIALQKGDLIYTFSDGYADQFGGQKNKKFKYRQLMQLLMQNKHMSMEAQRNALAQTMVTWKGETEQVDDMLLIGVRIV
ncbi:MAG TPA: tetratricopeptide repeat protein [Bacteroidia bacterium]|nr:tetratricopeptide repeat protein [Bacteroidia bacterium]